MVPMTWPRARVTVLMPQGTRVQMRIAGHATLRSASGLNDLVAVFLCSGGKACKRF